MRQQRWTSGIGRRASWAHRAYQTLRALTVVAALAGVLVVGEAPALADGPGAGVPFVVSVGDSYISGEGGRWAGNTNDESWRTDALGGGAYWDAPAGGESIDRCHRSGSAPVHIGHGVGSANLACSGARTATFTDGDGNFKPGLDFADTPAGRGQALMLQEFASTHNVRMVAVSIGGNNFRFGDVVQTCVQDFLLSPSFWKDYCNDDSSVTRNFTTANVSNQTAQITDAIGNVITAMERAGYDDSSYGIVVVDYPSPLATSGSYRYGESGFGRQTTGGCGFWNRDANWAQNTAVASVNGAVSEAVARVGRPHVRLLDVSGAFAGRRLCENTVGLLEERGIDSWQSPGAVDQTEWVTQIRTLSTVFGDYYVQESLHPNYWGQLALRNCLRQAYDGGAVRGGTCTRLGGGLNPAGEPEMWLS
jgi:hypothetical protein